jgi:hypothetical protein
MGKNREKIGSYGLTVSFFNDGSVEVKVDGKTNDMRVVSVLEIEKTRFINTMMSQAKKHRGGTPVPGKGGEA